MFCGTGFPPGKQGSSRNSEMGETLESCKRYDTNCLEFGKLSLLWSKVSKLTGNPWKTCFCLAASRFEVANVTRLAQQTRLTGYRLGSLDILFLLFFQRWVSDMARTSKNHFKSTGIYHQYIYIYKILRYTFWRFPEIGYPQNIHFNRIFHYKTIHYWVPKFYKVVPPSDMFVSL